MVLPLLLGPFFAQVIALVALYILLGLGLNITLGLAGLLDLGFVAFFAVGAYTVGLLTSTAEYGLAGRAVLAGAPVRVLFASIFGTILGLPILGIRGDYLAIATLGFGEIIRILAGSNLLIPLLGGPRGIINIPKPIDVPPTTSSPGRSRSTTSPSIFAALVAFVAWRLRAGRIGRAWVAIREDEDVAEAMGVNLVQTKLLAYMLGAAFAGLGGAIFAGLVGSIFPSSIKLFVSINVAAIVIVGGMGSIPGVVLGALFLIGLPELFREFADYRFLFYGVALIGDDAVPPGRAVAVGHRAARAARRRRGAGDDRGRHDADHPGDDVMTLLVARAVTKRFGGLARGQQARLRGRAGRHRQRHRAERRRQDDVLQLHRRASTTSRGRDRARRRADPQAPSRPDRPPRHVPDLPEHPAVREHDRDGEHPGRPAPPSAIDLDRHRPRHEVGKEDEKKAQDEAGRLLRYVGLRGKGDLLASKLPYGDQRRLEIARALANKPRLLLLDEPTAGMNPAETAQLTDFIRNLRDELGITPPVTYRGPRGSADHPTA